VQIAVDVAAAMAYLHEDQSPSVVHRDLKSHNLLIDRRGVVKLCDFGLVRTKTSLAGTPAYMAPELFNSDGAGGGGGGGYNKSVDVYAFGVLLWEIFAQEIPFSGYDIDGIRSAVGRGDRPRIPTVDTPQDIRKLMAECWHQSPAERPEFGSILRELKELLRTTPERSELEELETAGGFGGDALDDLLSFGGK